MTEITDRWICKHCRALYSNLLVDLVRIQEFAESGDQFQTLAAAGFHIYKDQQRPHAGRYHRRTNVGQEKNQQVFVVVGGLSQHIERLHCNVRIIVGDDQTAVFVIDRAALLELVGC